MIYLGIDEEHAAAVPVGGVGGVCVERPAGPRLRRRLQQPGSKRILG